MTFSLSSGNSADPCRSKTASRSEFEPKSMMPMRPAADFACRSDIGKAQLTTSFGWARRGALPRPDRLGLVMK